MVCRRPATHWQELTTSCQTWYVALSAQLSYHFKLPHAPLQGVHTRAGAAMARMLEVPLTVTAMTNSIHLLMRSHCLQLMSRIRTMPTTRGRTETAALGVFASTTAALLLGETLALERGYSEAVAASRKRSRPSSGSGSGSGNDDDGDVDPGAAVQAVNAYRTKLRSHGTSSGGNSGTSNDANTGPSGAAAAAASARLAAYTALLGGLDTPALAEIVAYVRMRCGFSHSYHVNSLYLAVQAKVWRWHSSIVQRSRLQQHRAAPSTRGACQTGTAPAAAGSAEGGRGPARLQGPPTQVRPLSFLD